jgi:hypothetical protein
MGCQEIETQKRKNPVYNGDSYNQYQRPNKTDIYPEQKYKFKKEDYLNSSNNSKVKIPKYRNYPKIKLLKNKKPLNYVKTNNNLNSNNENKEFKNSINLIFPPKQPINSNYTNYVSFSPPPKSIVHTARVTKLPNNNDISIQNSNEGISNYSFKEIIPENIPNLGQNNFEENLDNLSGSRISYSPKYPSVPYYEDLASSLNSTLNENYINSFPTKEIINLPLTKSIELNYNDNNNNIITQRSNSPDNLKSNNNSLNSSLNGDVLKYFNNLEINEFENFDPDLWRMFYPNEESFFNFDKGDVMNTETTSQNKFGETETYIGEVNEKGEKHGFGKLYSNKYKRIGTWRNNKFMGWGREIRPSGELYEGKFIKDELIGKGIYKNDKILYIGDFYKYIKHGKGDLFSKKLHYKGYFYNNKFYGNGRLDLYQQGIYEGKFRDNQMNGKGIFMWKDGNIYQGEMKDGMICGEGKLIKKNGFIYEGMFVDGPNHGYGTITYPDGKKYEGRFSKGKSYHRSKQ